MKFLESVKNFFRKKQQVFFVIGTGRCGTTMLAQMLNAHSMICVPNELQVLFEYSNNGFRLYEVFKEKKNQHFSCKDFVKLIDDRCPHKLNEYFDYKSFFERQQYPIHNLKALVNSFFSEIAQSQGKKIFIEQTPWYGQRIDILHELFPDAKYIHIVRDGRDVAISFARTPWWHNDIGENLHRWDAEVGQIIESSAQILDSNQILQVRYEDIVDHPEIELERICDFIGVKFENSMLDPKAFIDYSLYGKINEKNISSAELNKWSENNKSTPVFKGSQYAWKIYTEYDFSSIPDNVNKRLNSLGYETI